jgi:hypothetical protein
MAYQILLPVQILEAESMAASIASGAVEVKNQDNIGIQLKWTGAPVGTLGVQVSSDYLEDSQGNILNAGNWVALPLSPAITAAGAPDDAYIDLNQLSAMYVRVTYTRTSGTGALSAIVVGKAV